MVQERGEGPAPPMARRRPSRLSLIVRTALVLLLVVGILEVQSEAGYRLPAGSVTFQLQPSWPGGRLIMPLGPAGELSLRTHRTPVDVVMTYRLPAETAALLSDGSLSEDLPLLEGGARAAFTRYLVGRTPWLLLIGAAGGLLVAGTWPRRRLVWGGVAGMAVALALGGGVVLASYATLDSTPTTEYRGLASKVPAMLPLLRALSTGGEQSDRLSRLADYFDGLATVASQLTAEPRRPARADVVRLLLASDIHDNVFGARAAARLAAGDGSPVDAVLLAGDITDRGTTQEAQLFTRAFGRPATPVLVVGGNHEDEPAMRVFDRAGYIILDDSVSTISGVSVLGASDPVARVAEIDADVAGLAVAGARLAAVWAETRPEPQVVLVHDVRQARATIMAAEKEETALVVAYGNDHVAGVGRQGSVVLVDAGTAGASGYEAIGSASPEAGAEPSAGSRDTYTFQLLDFTRDGTPWLAGVTTLTYAGDGRTIVSYAPFGR